MARRVFGVRVAGDALLTIVLIALIIIRKESLWA
jgi:hypothetical protein